MQENTLVHIFKCACKPDFIYANRTSYRNHMKSQQHRLYEMDKRLRETAIEMERLRIDLENCKRECEVWKNLYMKPTLQTTEEELT